MKKCNVIFLVLLVALGWARYGEAFEKGFRKNEAGEMVDLCINVNGDGMVTNGVARDTLIPADWEEVFDSAQGQVGGSDADSGFGPYFNRWKLWQSKSRPNTYAIVIRGTIADPNSIKQDFIATSMDATNTTVAGRAGFREYRGVRFRLAETTGAEVHTGFTFGLAILMFDEEKGILNRLREMVPAESEIFITGHSQGAAIATLAHSFLYYAVRDNEFDLGAMGYRFKSYVFAQPKPGNWQYAMDFAQNIGNGGMSFTVNNTYDVVPQVPLSIQLISETASPFANGRLVPEYLVRTLKGLRLTASNFTNRMFSTLDQVAKRFDAKYCIAGSSLRTSKGDSLAYMPVGNVMAVRSEHGDEPLPKDDQLREHHLGLYKVLLSQLESQ
ncbi:MAG: lipase family protein [Thermodesulfobacteriota bacterium]